MPVTTTTIVRAGRENAVRLAIVTRPKKGAARGEHVDLTPVMAACLIGSIMETALKAYPDEFRACFNNGSSKANL